MFKNNRISPSEITPKHVYLSRRDFIKAAGVLAGSLALAACGGAPDALEASAPPPSASPQPPASPQSPAGTESPASTNTPASVETPASSMPSSSEAGKLTSFEDVTNYNNYYEFTTSKEGVADLAKNLKTSPWEVEISGLARNTGKVSVADLVKKYPPEERIYRMRCVETWSMVIPWLGFPLAQLLKDAEPQAEAKYVRFETLYAPDEMPGVKAAYYPWPYQEGLRLDEALNDLTLLATGLYGGELPAQNGGGIRLVVPWKYGFKSIKSIVKIELVAEQPSTFWNTLAPEEYGFYANVNPQVPHPRWSQASESLIGQSGRQETLLFNGYAEEVASLYAGMDLSKFY